MDDGEDNVDFSSLFEKTNNTSSKPGKKQLALNVRPKVATKQAQKGRQKPSENAEKKQPNKKRKAVATFGEARSGCDEQLAVGGVTHEGKKRRISTDFWPFEVDYNDHFETSFRAIQDIQPVLKQLCKKLKKSANSLAIYDPFFCKGGIRRHYEALGFTNFIHRNRDFYADVAEGCLPEYDILMTNPPYSADHKERILEFCLRSGKPWALLLPNYVANKAYFAELLSATGTPGPRRPFFLTPRVRYSYDHPAGTGHAESPFYSIWFVGLNEHTEAIHAACQAAVRQSGAVTAGGAPSKSGVKRAGVLSAGAGEGASGGGDRGNGGAVWDITLARTVDALKLAGAVPTAKRLNPKQREKLKRKKGQGGGAEG